MTFLNSVNSKDSVRNLWTVSVTLKTYMWTTCASLPEFVDICVLMQYNGGLLFLLFMAKKSCAFNRGFFFFKSKRFEWSAG